MKSKIQIPFSFVLENLHPKEPRIKQMFGCFAVYVEQKIIFILRKREDHLEDNGVWLATSVHDHDALRKIFPAMRSISVLGKGVTNWQIIREDSRDFERSVLRLCNMVKKGDKRIGHIPKNKKKQITHRTKM